jgi:hypothetical protein
MSNFPSAIDDDSTIPSVYDNITEIGSEAINALKEAVINIEEEIGLTASGSLTNLADRLNVSLNPDGTINPSALTSLGLVTLPIDNTQIATNAAILESKLDLDHSTQDLYNMIINLGLDSNTALSWINLNSSKITSHIDGTAYNHYTDQILVAQNTNNYLQNKFESNRNNTNLYTLLDDINTDFVNHQRADGYGTSNTVETLTGLTFPDTYAHHPSGIYIDSSRFISVPRTVTDLQILADFIDSSSLLLFGSRVQNFFTNGVSRASRSFNFNNDGYAQILIEPVLATAYLRTNGTNTNPVDDIDTGDDIIELFPSGTIETSNTFDAQFSLVKAGDVVTINYGTIETKFIIKEKKYIQSGGNKKFIIRIDGKNLAYTTTASVIISKPTYHTNKQHVLALAQAHNEFSTKPSLIAAHPRSASVLGLGFNANLLDSTHYNLYLKLYPTGNPADGEISLPAIDVTGNQGITPGKYNLSYIVKATNDAFRAAGKNYRFIAFEYDGEFGIAMSDPYLNSSFSIVNAIVDATGAFDQTATNSAYPNNVIDVFEYLDNLSQTQQPKDALGFGLYAANVASPPYKSTYSTPEEAVPTKVYIPLTKNNYYVNGTEKDKFGLEVDQILDIYGDGYWLATVTNQNITPGPNGRVETTYQVNLDLRSSKLEIGKTLVIQPLNDGYDIDAGRFIINNVGCIVCSPTSAYSEITVFDAVHAQVSSPQTTLAIGTQVRLYFCDDSIGFNQESATDFTSVSQFKRFFEVYIDANGKTFTHERARYTVNSSNLTVNGQTLYASQNVSAFDIIDVSKKLRGYQSGSLNKITFRIVSFDANGLYSGYLSKYDGITTKQGPLTIGYAGQVVRFFDESQIDYIDFKLDVDFSIGAFTDEFLDIQLFPSLELDKEVFLLGSCTLNDAENLITSLVDKREFGNVSEQELTKSTIDFIGAGEKYLHTNGVVQGFDLDGYAPNPADNQIYLNGGIASINGKFILMNADTVEIPILRERFGSRNYNILWALCINDKNEYVTYPILDIPAVDNLTSSRRFTAIDSTGATYRIEALKIDSLLNRKDLLVLYTVESTLIGSSAPFTTSLDIADVRRYAYSTDSSYVRYTSSKEFGNFRSVKTLLNWLKLSNVHQSYANLKNANETFTENLTISSDTLIEIDGENDSTLTFNNCTLTLENVILKNLSLDFSSTFANLLTLTNSKLINCTINGEYTQSLTVSGYFCKLSGSDLIDCSLNVEYVGDGYSGDEALSLEDNVNIIGLTGSMTCSVGTDNTPNFISSTTFSNIKITNSSFSGNFKKVAEFTSCSNIDFSNNTISSSFDGTNESTYVTGNIVNYITGGVLDIRVGSRGNSTNININNNTFSTTTNRNRLSYIGALLNVNNATITGLNITNNKFNSLSFVEADMKAAIHVITYVTNTASSSTTGYLINSKIENNYCNNHQNIILSSAIHSDNNISLKLSTINVSVNNNICGSIGYFTSFGTKSSPTVSFPMTFSTSNAQDFNLSIKENNCHYIRLADGYGRTFFLSVPDNVNNTSLTTGNVIIENNTSNYIHVGTNSTTNGSLIIKNNSLPGYTEDYITLDPFVNLESGFQTLTSSIQEYSMYVGGRSATSNLGNCIIEGNIVYSSSWNVTYQPIGYLRADINAIIKNNIFRGTSGNVDLIVVGGDNTIIESNTIFRTAFSVTSYIKWDNLINTSYNGETSLGVVTNNIFDSSTIDGSTDNLLKGNFPPRWIVNQNINQVEYANFVVVNGLMQGTTKNNRNLSNDATLIINPLRTSLDGNEGSLITVLQTTDTNAKYFSYVWNLNNHLPTNSKLIEFKFSLRKGSAAITLVSSSSTGFYATINKLTNTFSNQSANIDVSSGSIATSSTNDPYVDTSTDVSIGISADDYNATSLNAALTPEITISANNFIINNGSPILLTFTANFQLSSGTLDTLVSPILIKYRW